MRPLAKDLIGINAFGRKALGLARLLDLGFSVPDAFVISPSEPLDEASVWGAVERWTQEALGSSGRARLAVRSSSPAEDSSAASHAGEFTSILDVFDSSDLMQAVKEVRESGQADPLPVIVQVGVDPLYSGVAFSCDPVSLERGLYVVSWVKGNGAQLVSGRETGSLLVLRSLGEGGKQWPHQTANLGELVSALKDIEQDLGYPADVEWTIDQNGKLWILQARPVVLPKPQCADARSSRDLMSLPGVVAGHPKIRLRAAANRRKVMMSSAAVLTVSSGDPELHLPEGLPSHEAAGLSIVLLHPYHASNKILREFAQVDEMDVPFFTLGCQRYSIRRYPSPETAMAVARDILQRGLEQNWMASAVVQEIYDAEATGIVRKLGDDFLVELAVGHFVPKGVVDPTRIIVSADGKILETLHVEQETAYRFINGHVVTEHPVEQQLQLSDQEVAAAIEQISPLFADYPDAALEFGILKHKDGSVQGYVIDMAEGDSKSCALQLTRELIREGVVSPGRVTGTVVRIPNDGDSGLDTHLLESFSVPDEAAEDVVVADRASVDLLPLVNRCGRNTAFVFRNASLLAHLCVVLRERGIAAMTVEDSDLFARLATGVTVTVEATSGEGQGPRVTLEAAQDPLGSCQPGARSGSRLFPREVMNS